MFGDCGNIGANYGMYGSNENYDWNLQQETVKLASRKDKIWPHNWCGIPVTHEWGIKLHTSTKYECLIYFSLK